MHIIQSNSRKIIISGFLWSFFYQKLFSTHTHDFVNYKVYQLDIFSNQAYFFGVRKKLVHLLNCPVTYFRRRIRRKNMKRFKFY